MRLSTIFSEELFFVFFLFFVHVEFKMFAAVGAIHFAFVNNATINADNFAASRALYFIEVVAVAIAVIIIAAAVAIAVIVAAAIVIFIVVVLEGFKVFIDKFDLFANFCKSVLYVFYIICEIFKNVSDSSKYFVIAVKTFHKSFKMCNFSAIVMVNSPLP